MERKKGKERKCCDHEQMKRRRRWKRIDCKCKRSTVKMIMTISTMKEERKPWDTNDHKQIETRQKPQKTHKSGNTNGKSTRKLTTQDDNVQRGHCRISTSPYIVPGA